VPDLGEGADPDDAFSRVPYEKGFNLCVLALQRYSDGKEL
jgi:hypothetical protein